MSHCRRKAVVEKLQPRSLSEQLIWLLEGQINLHGHSGLGAIASRVWGGSRPSKLEKLRLIRAAKVRFERYDFLQSLIEEVKRL